MRTGAIIFFTLSLAPCLVWGDGMPLYKNDRFDGGHATIAAINEEKLDAVFEYVGYDAAEKFIRQWLLLGEKDDNLDVVMECYGDSVIYYKFGVVDKQFIWNDKKKYYKKWPQRKYSLQKFETVYAGESNAFRMFDVFYHFEISSDKEALTGEAKVRLSLSQRNGILTIGQEEGQVNQKTWKSKAKNVLAPAPATTRELIRWLQKAWLAGRDEEEVKAKLALSVWPNGTPTLLSSTDLKGDGSAEWLLTIYDKEKSPYEEVGGEFWVINAKGIAYKYRFQGDSAPRLDILTDLTGDALPDAVISAHGCGASTCFADYVVISAHGGQIRKIGTFSMLSPEEPKLTIDKPPAIIIKGGIATSTGAGTAQREHTDIWAWNGSAMALKETVWERTKWRHHVLYDGIFAHEKGNYSSAIASYLRVINDNDLENDEAWDGRTGTMVSSYNSCRQFAAFRLVLLDLQQGEVDKASGWRDWLGTNYPSAAITRAAKNLVYEWSLSKDLSSACLKSSGQLKTEDRPTWPLDDLGNNLRLRAGDVCPTQQVETFMNRARNGY